jgi:hypothetical protein
MSDKTKVLSFQLTAQDANIILSALGELPAKQVMGLIAKLQQQAAPQFAEPSDGAEVPPSE